MLQSIRRATDTCQSLPKDTELVVLLFFTLKALNL